MAVSAEQKHHVPGRLRLRVPSARRDPALLDSIRERLARAPGATAVDANSTTGALIVQYDPAKYADFPQTLSSFAREQGILDFDPSSDSNGAEKSIADRALGTALSSADRVVKTGTANAVSLRELMPFGIAAWAVLFVDRALAASEWLNWLQFAVSSYFDLHADEPVREVERKVDALRSELAGIRELIEKQANH